MKKLALINKKTLSNFDWPLLLLVTAIVIYGAIAITSATSTAYDPEAMSVGSYLQTLNYQYSGLHMIFFAAGLAVIAVLLILDYNNLRYFSTIIYWISVALLAFVLLSENINGINAWFKIGQRGFQPSEFSKIAIIIVLAKEFAKRTEGRDEGISTLREIWPMLWRIAIPLVLIMLQPDYGTALVYIFVFAGMMFVSKTRLRIIGILGLSFAALLPLVWNFFMQDYQKTRLLIFTDPYSDPTGDGLQIIRAMTAGSSGGFWGKGLFSQELLTQQKNYLPEKHTDFIFASTLEAVGTFGGIILLILYLLLILRLVQISFRAKDDFGAFMTIGFAFMLLFHVFENVGMNMGAMPITGIPLPFFSYGGSNMLTNMICIGLAISVSMRRNKYSI